eukprot:scaffold131352_cov23-Tisochrysis_lutea.AAC.3
MKSTRATLECGFSWRHAWRAHEPHAAPCVGLPEHQMWGTSSARGSADGWGRAIGHMGSGMWYLRWGHRGSTDYDGNATHEKAAQPLSCIRNACEGSTASLMRMSCLWRGRTGGTAYAMPAWCLWDGTADMMPV